MPVAITKKAVVTTYIIAKHAGVHQSTVSRVLNGSPHIPAATVRKVMKVCQELNYVPNIMARGFREQKSFLLAVHIPFDSRTVFADPFVAEFLRGIRSEASKRGYSIMLSYANPEDSNMEFVNIIKSRRADGIIIASIHQNDERIGVLIEHNIPAVVGLYPDKLPQTIASVDIDNQHTGAQAVRFAISRGYRNISTLVSKCVNCPNRNFENGVQMAATEAGIPREKVLFHYVNDTVSDGITKAREILSDDRSQAIIVENTLSTFGVAKVMESCGRDFLLIGMGSPLFDQLYPGFCKIVQPAEELGRENVKAFCEILQTGKSPNIKLLYTHIVDSNGWVFRERPPK